VTPLAAAQVPERSNSARGGLDPSDRSL
jgi:hypothetical protein